MRTYFLTLVLAMFCGCLSAQTYIKHQQKVKGQWTKKNSPYIIQGEAVVEKGTTLIIESGVTVKFQTSENGNLSGKASEMGFLSVNGCLKAKGGSGALIRFSGTENKSYWGGIIFSNSNEDNELYFCEFIGAGVIEDIVNHKSYKDANGAITVVNAKLTMTDCAIHNNYYGVCCINSSVLLDNCLIFKNQNLGVYSGYGSKTKIDHCTLFNNQFSEYQSTNSIKNTIIWADDNFSKIEYVGKGKNKTLGFYSNFKAYKGKLTYSCIKGYSNSANHVINCNPLFASEKRNNFRLNEGSPCIATGENKTDMGVLFEKGLFAHLSLGESFDHRILFARGKSYLSQEAKNELDKIFNKLKKQKRTKLVIAGHADETGNKASNFVLSEKRAKAAKKYLRNKGIDAERLTIKAFGETRPVDTNNTEKGRQNNRRVEFLII